MEKADKVHQCRIKGHRINNIKIWPFIAAAFLPLMVFKIKNKQIAKQKTPNDPKDIKQLSNFNVVHSTYFYLAFVTTIFSWILDMYKGQQ